MYTKLSCPSQKPAAGSINAIVEILDNTIFISLAFAFTVSWANIAIMILVHFTIMFIWTFVAQPITVKVTQWAKKGEPITA